MKEEKILDYNHMFEHACAFVDCAEACFIEPSSFKLRLKSHGAAAIVNSAFACEIFIKSMLVFNMTPASEIRGHELLTLWNQLKTKDAVLVNNIEDTIVSLFETDNTDMFISQLEIASNAFEHWRYIYEKEESTINANFLRLLMYELRAMCCNKFYNLDWIDYVKCR